MSPPFVRGMCCHGPHGGPHGCCHCAIREIPRSISYSTPMYGAAGCACNGSHRGPRYSPNCEQPGSVPVSGVPMNSCANSNIQYCNSNNYNGSHCCSNGPHCGSNGSGYLSNNRGPGSDRCDHHGPHGQHDCQHGYQHGCQHGYQYGCQYAGSNYPSRGGRNMCSSNNKKEKCTSVSNGCQVSSPTDVTCSPVQNTPLSIPALNNTADLPVPTAEIKN